MKSFEYNNVQNIVVNDFFSIIYRIQLDDNERACGCLWKSKDHKGKKLEKERIKQFSIWYEEVDSARQREFAQRRLDRQYLREKKQRRVKCFRRLFIPTVICWLFGFCMILASTVKGLGEGTIFWTMRDRFHVIGPVTLGIGLILLMVTEGLISNHQIKIKRLESLLATPEEEIDINDQQTYPNQTTVNAGQRTSKAFSGQLPRLHQEDETDKLFSEKVPFIPDDPGPCVKQKSNSVKQIKQKLNTIESTVQKTNVDLNTQSNNGDELPIGATPGSFESEQALNKPILQGENEKVMSLTSLPPWEYHC